MCGPLAMPLVGAGLAVAGTIAQTRAAKRNAAAEQAAIAANRDQQIAETNAANMQAMDQSQENISDTARQLLQAQARMAAAAAEGGVSGNSVNTQLSDLALQGAETFAVQKKNASATFNQNKLQQRSISSRAQSAINQSKNNTPTWIGAGLQIGQTLTSGYSRLSDPSQQVVNGYVSRGTDKLGQWFGFTK